MSRSNATPQAGAATTAPAGLTRFAGRLPSVRLGEVLGVAPFIVFAVMFLVLPPLYLLGLAFTDKAGQFTLQNIADLGSPLIVSAFWISILISAASAVIGAVAGLFIALAVIRGNLPGWVRSLVATFSGVASNFAGVPLAFAFIATIGRLGIVTIVLRTVFHVDIYRSGFNLFSFSGLTLIYCYFQIPLTILLIAPAIDGLKREWSEAAETLGARPWQFWAYVGMPVLWPNLLGTLSLLFANAFGAVATAYALTGTSINIITLQLYAQIRGDALQNPGLGAAIALAMVLIAALANVIYLIVRTRAERWLK